MSKVKALVGAIPSRVVSRLIRNSAPSSRAASLVELVNSYPKWFAAVDRRVLTTTRFGFSIWCDRWDVIGKAIIKNGQWEGLLSRTILASLKPGDVAIDIGANIGYDTMLMSTAVGRNGCVVAFEPDLKNLSLLLENLCQIPETNVIVQSLGLSDEGGISRIALADEGNRGTSNLRPGEKGDSQPLLVTRLDQVLAAKDLQKIGLVKIDIEGFEHKAILGMGELLDKVEVLACEVDPNYLRQCGTSPAAIFDIMQAKGFTSFCAQPNSDDKWVRSGPDFKIAVKESFHFDALFCRNVSPRLDALIQH